MIQWYRQRSGKTSPGTSSYSEYYGSELQPFQTFDKQKQKNPGKKAPDDVAFHDTIIDVASSNQTTSSDKLDSRGQHSFQNAV